MERFHADYSETHSGRFPITDWEMPRRSGKRRCTACHRPCKGHPGPTGAKCAIAAAAERLGAPVDSIQEYPPLPLPASLGVLDKSYASRVSSPPPAASRPHDQPSASAPPATSWPEHDWDDYYDESEDDEDNGLDEDTQGPRPPHVPSAVGTTPVSTAPPHISTWLHLWSLCCSVTYSTGVLCPHQCLAPWSQPRPTPGRAFRNLCGSSNRRPLVEPIHSPICGPYDCHHNGTCLVLAGPLQRPLQSWAFDRPPSRTPLDRPLSRTPR